MLTTGNSKALKAVGVLIALIALYAIDLGLRTNEASQLVSNIEASEKTMETYNADVKRISEADMSRETAIRGIVAIAEKSASEIYVSGVAVERMTILPWHKKLKTARSDYMQHSDAWYELTSNTKIGSGDELTINWGNGDDITPTFNLLKVTLPQAIPSPDLLDLQTRVTEIVKS